MNHSSPDYVAIDQPHPYRTMPQQEDPYNRQQQTSISLTPEERRILQECSKEGVFKRGIPTGIVFGLAGLLGARAGVLMSSRFGVKPAVIGLGTLGYFIGRFSYTKVCMQRVLEVPDGNFRKIMTQQGVLRQNMEPPFGKQDPSNFYAPIDVPKDQNETWNPKRNDSDINDGVHTSSFDTVPSEYYAVIDDQKDQPEEIRPQSYTSHDDLRKRNRQEFMNRLYSDQRPSYEQPAPQVTRPRISRETPPVESTGPQTKYGDSWE